MNTTQILILSCVLAAVVLAASFLRTTIVAESSVALLYRSGKLDSTLGPGRHIHWGVHLNAQHVDLRQTLLHVPGQEVLTADNIAVKISLVLRTQIVSPVLTVQAADNYVAHLYTEAQTALRKVVAGVSLDALLNDRTALSGQILPAIAARAESLGVQIHGAEVRDIMLPGDLRKAFAETVRVRQEGQAALEKARAESATLRNLANAARLLESHPGLGKLRFLQSLEAPGIAKTVVLNDLAAVLGSVKPAVASSNDDNNHLT